MQVKELNLKERPRERALEIGIDQLQNRELLALLLRSGTVGKSALELADEILASYTLNDLNYCSIKDLAKFKGCGKAKALELLACFELARRVAKEQLIQKKRSVDLNAIGEWLQKEIGGKGNEHFVAVYLDQQNCLIQTKTISIGSLDRAEIYPRKVFLEALNCNAAKIVVAHNHPSQSTVISSSDLRTTYMLVQNGNLLQIPLVDHLIVTKNETKSIIHSDPYRLYVINL